MLTMLLDLYQVVDSCYKNERMEFCPIILKINNKMILKEYGYDYLL